MLLINNIKKKFIFSFPKGLDKERAKKTIFAIAFPALAELFLLQLASIIDMGMVSKLGEWAIAAINYSNQPRFATQMIFVALHTGTTALIARFRGEGDKKNCNITMRQTIILSLFLGLIVSLVGYYFSKQMIIAMNATEKITIEEGTIYLKIQMLSFTFMAITMAITASLRGIGLTKIPLFYNIISNIINIIFNYFLIYGIWFFPKMGVAGASLATSIGQVVAFVIAMYFIRKPDFYLTFRLRHLFVIDLSIIKRIIKVAIPAMFEQFIMRVGMIIYVNIIASLGTTIYATHSIAIQLLNFSYLNGQAFGIAATSLLGQSLGENNVENAKAYTHYCRRLSVLVGWFISLILVLFGKNFMLLFSENQEVITKGSQVLLFVSFIQPMQASQLVLTGALRGAGDTKSTAFITTIGILIIRPVICYILVFNFNLELMGAWSAMMADQVLRFFYSKYRFASNKWVNIKV